MTQLCFGLLLGAATTLAVAWSCATWSEMSRQTPVAFLAMTQDAGWWFSADCFGGLGATRRELSAAWARTDAEGHLVSQSDRIQITKDHFIFRGYLGLPNFATSPPPEPPVHRLPIDHTRWSRLAGLSNFDNQSGDFVEEEGAFGWPMLAMWCSFETRTWVIAEDGKRTWQPARPTSLYQPSASFQFSLPAGMGDRPLPLRPIALGFVVDTAFYSFAWWSLLLGIPRARRWNRCRKNRCVQCAYELRGIDSQHCPECGRNRA